MFEAARVALVAVLAAWSGYAAAKWSTESSLLLATASGDRTGSGPGATPTGRPANSLPAVKRSGTK